MLGVHRTVPRVVKQLSRRHGQRGESGFLWALVPFMYGSLQCLTLLVFQDDAIVGRRPKLSEMSQLLVRELHFLI